MAVIQPPHAELLLLAVHHFRPLVNRARAVLVFWHGLFLPLPCLSLFAFLTPPCHVSTHVLTVPIFSFCFECLNGTHRRAIQLALHAHKYVLAYGTAPERERSLPQKRQQIVNSCLYDARREHIVRLCIRFHRFLNLVV